MIRSLLLSIVIDAIGIAVMVLVATIPPETFPERILTIYINKLQKILVRVSPATGFLQPLSRSVMCSPLGVCNRIDQLLTTAARCNSAVMDQ